MPKTCNQCGASLTAEQTFCRACGTLTGLSGVDPTLILRRPGPNTASPWAKIGSPGDTTGAMPKAKSAPETVMTVGPAHPANTDIQISFRASASPVSPPPDMGVPPPPATTTRIVRKATGIQALRGWLVAVTGPESGRDWRIHPGKNSLGRGTGVDIALNEDSVSTVHAIIWVQDDNSLMLVDRDSSNGTYVNNVQIFQPTQLNDGDLIRLGEIVTLQWTAFSPKKP